MQGNNNNHIIIVDTSQIISEGLLSVINKHSQRYQVSTTNSIEGMELLFAKRKSEIIIINPNLINNTKAFNTLRNTIEQVKWVGLVYAYYEQDLLSKFDALITISDNPESILSKINKLLVDENQQDSNASQEVLSEREIDVLKLLAGGLSNKEIADKLNISIHTVISHRKNITQKTGIKSVSGLTIYAVVQKIITTDSISL
jgi:DNA-binding NarL/FixJ family response regulator